MTKFSKRGLIYSFNFSTLCIANSTCIWSTALKFGSRTVLSLHLAIYRTENFRLHEVMPLQSHKIGCVYKTPFCKFSNICCYGAVVIMANYNQATWTTSCHFGICIVWTVCLLCGLTVQCCDDLGFGIFTELLNCIIVETQPSSSLFMNEMEIVGIYCESFHFES